MGATLSSGSKSTRYATAGTKVPVASGDCVLDKILVNGASAATDFSCIVRTVTDNTELHTFVGIDTTDAELVRLGLFCGPFGIGSADGLELVLAGTLGIDITAVYRTGLT